MAQLVYIESLANQIEVTVNIKKLKPWRNRLWIAEKLFRLGAWVAQIGYSDIDPIESMEILGHKGIVISVCYGPMYGKGIGWSVDCLHDKESFERPYQANSFEHCIEIATIEANKRGWLT